MTRLEVFPLPAEVMPARLKALLGEVTTEQPIEVAASFEHDKYGLGQEAVHLTMRVVPAGMRAKRPELRQFKLDGGYIENWDDWKLLMDFAHETNDPELSRLAKSGGKRTL